MRILWINPMTEGYKAMEEDRAEVLILGCAAEYEFHRRVQDGLGTPIADVVLAPFKHAEMQFDAAACFGWYPRRRWSSEALPQAELDAWRLFR